MGIFSALKSRFYGAFGWQKSRDYYPKSEDYFAGKYNGAEVPFWEPRQREHVSPWDGQGTRRRSPVTGFGFVQGEVIQTTATRVTTGQFDATEAGFWDHTEVGVPELEYPFNENTEVSGGLVDVVYFNHVGRKHVKTSDQLGGGAPQPIMWQGRDTANGGQFIVDGHGCNLVCFHADQSSKSIRCFLRDAKTGEDGDTLWTITDLSDFKMQNLPDPDDYIWDYGQFLTDQDDRWEYQQYVNGWLVQQYWTITQPHDGRFVLAGFLDSSAGALIQIRSMETGALLSQGWLSDGNEEALTGFSWRSIFRGPFTVRHRAIRPVADDAFIAFTPFNNFLLNDLPAEGFAMFRATLDPSDTYRSIANFSDVVVSDFRVCAAEFLGSDLYAVKFASEFAPSGGELYGHPVDYGLVKVEPATLTIIAEYPDAVVGKVPFEFLEAYVFPVPLIAHNGKLYAFDAARMYRWNPEPAEGDDENFFIAFSAESLESHELLSNPNIAWFDSPRGIIRDLYPGGDRSSDEGGNPLATCENFEHCVTCNNQQCYEGHFCYCVEGAAGQCIEGQCDCCLSYVTMWESCHCPGGWQGVCCGYGCECTGAAECGCGANPGDPCTCKDGTEGNCLDGRCIDCGAPPRGCIDPEGNPLPPGTPCECYNGRKGVCIDGDCRGCNPEGPDGCVGRADSTECVCTDGTPGECDGGKCVGEDGEDCACPECGPTDGPCDGAGGESCQCDDGRPGTCEGGRCIDEDGEDCGGGGGGGGEPPYDDPCDNTGIGGPPPDGTPCTCCDGSESECVDGECDCECKSSNTGNSCTVDFGCPGTCKNGCCKPDPPCDCSSDAAANWSVGCCSFDCASFAGCAGEVANLECGCGNAGGTQLNCTVKCRDICDGNQTQPPNVNVSVSGSGHFCAGQPEYTPFTNPSETGQGQMTVGGGVYMCLGPTDCTTFTVTVDCTCTGNDDNESHIEEEFSYGPGC